MARRRKAEQRTLAPDPTYNSELVAKVINFTMRCGKKSTAERIVYGALGFVSEKMSDEPIEVLIKAIDNMKPRVEVKSRRVGGATYQVPVEVRPSRRQALAMRWLVEYSRGRGEKSMPLRLAGEILDASQGKGGAVKKREDVHRMAEANKAFSHYRF